VVCIHLLFKSLIGTDVREFLSNVIEPMTASRRTQAIPPDFEFALRKMGLTEELLTPHLTHPASPKFTSLQFELAPPGPELSLPTRNQDLIGPELSGVAEKKSRSYIPEHAPPFPPTYTFKSTYVLAERDTDPRKIREKGVEESKIAEGVLRRLGQAGPSSQYARDCLDLKNMDSAMNQRHDLLTALHNEEVDKAQRIGLKTNSKKNEFIITNPDVANYGVQRSKRYEDNE
jgi:hypothetical protein